MWRAIILWLFICALGGSAQAAATGDHLLLKNDWVLRELVFNGHVWRTARFARADGADAVATDSDELHILNLDGTELTINDFAVDGEPIRKDQEVTISYKPRADRPLPAIVPQHVDIRYWITDGQPYLRKAITLVMSEGQAIDRLEVERFSINQPASRGGRGEPVFVNNTWFFGVEYPAAYARHTDGNTPKADSGPYDLFGNYSHIDLEGHDVDRHPRAGLIRLMHFPGHAKPTGNQWTIESKTAVAGIGNPGDSIELAFEDYLSTVRRPVRSFVHYNTYFDPEGKDLSVQHLVNRIYLPFKQHLDPFGVHVDAIVPDDGWQNKMSIYEPNPAQFPRGLADMSELADALQKAGTSMGLWIALNGYNSDIDWGIAHGYPEAVRNQRFKRFHRYYSITDAQYDHTIRQRLTDLIQQCHVQYFKHDFNEMCDLSDRGHLPDDRHGHEASVDEEIGLLALERQLNPQIYQNITNWIWFSPWWLSQGNSLWMLSSDSGDFLGYPEISALVRATVYRDVNLYQVWHDPATRPLVPISHLMTHGIIYTKSKYANVPGETLRDFGDYVMLYYCRGLQLKEWYINPNLLNDDQWRVLGRATRWSQENLQTLTNAVYVGGDPRKGEPYGYIAWDGERGILSVRNPSALPASITVPFDQTVWYRGPRDRTFGARVVYPYQAQAPGLFRPGTPMQFEIPAFSLFVMHLDPATSDAGPAPAMLEVRVRADRSDAHRATIELPDESMQRCDLLVTAHYTPAAKPLTIAGPAVQIDGKPAQPTRIARGLSWVMLSFDLRDRRGTTDISVDSASAKSVNAVVVLDRPVQTTAASDDPRLPEPLGHGFRRQSVQLLK